MNDEQPTHQAGEPATPTSAPPAPPAAAGELFARAPDTFHRWLATVATLGTMLYPEPDEGRPAPLERTHTTAALHASYRCFAAEHAERHPLSLVAFGTAMRRYAKPRRHVGPDKVRGYDLGAPPGETLRAALADAIDMSGRQALGVAEVLAELDAVLKAARVALGQQWKAVEALEAITVRARRRYEEMVRR